jgi:hypothetical protein
MSAHEIWELMVRENSSLPGNEPVPFHLGDAEEIISFLDDEEENKTMGRDAVKRQNDDEVFGTYLH